ncbi:unnamed protein product [Commensalibacter communis]|uniref:Uncharacterized protein n=1 Tax=Commensalibacter communis TaxID=2972786 RepID=A0A9W4XIH1_9PROT|nr:hypothetical protein [Commensalibacter communis]CAI3949064.1 unnamed protein product [Commensalibacter communis]CAI3950805.1 unnamed protein product [Commensalibacter communis]CAI3952186.1 unnamed protein product [Commensalibacter communis]CAI3952395.1 unnamed protein product [Commensalibacter communis]CAI3953322.1 unnamed protein product [Commensalibacter communis]
MFPNTSTILSVAIADEIQIIEKLADRRKAKTHYEWEVEIVDDKKEKRKYYIKIENQL